MKFYIKNTNTNEIQELEGQEKWLEEKPSNVDLNDYLCDRYIKTLSQNMRSFYCSVSKNDFDLQKIEEAKQSKIKEIKAQRDANLIKPTPQTVTYGGKLSNRTFNINVKEHLPIFNSIITILQSKVNAGAINPTRTWTDASGEVLELELGDYISLANHLDFRDAQEFAMCSKRIKALDGLSLEKVENFDITQIIE